MNRLSQMIAIGGISLSSLLFIPEVASASTLPNNVLSGVTVSEGTNGTYLIHFPNGREVVLPANGSIKNSGISYTTEIVQEPNGTKGLDITITFPNHRSVTIDPPLITD